MARIRTIKPEFWADQKTGTLPEFSKCLFLGLLNHADDYGVIEYADVEWGAKIFPYHYGSATEEIQDSLFQRLLPSGLVELFAFADDDDPDRQFLFIRNFTKHQVVNKPSSPTIAAWQKGDTPSTYAKRTGRELREPSIPVREHSGSDPEQFPEDSLRKEGRKEGKEGNGKEGKGRERGSAAKTNGATTHGSRFALTQLPDGWRSFCETKRPDLDPDATFDHFRDYWIAVPGAKGRKVDWTATWRTWVSREKAGQKKPGSAAAELLKEMGVTGAPN